MPPGAMHQQQSWRILLETCSENLTIAPLPKVGSISISGAPMSHHDQNQPHQPELTMEPDPADSKADAIAAFCAIAIAVCGVLYFISQQ